MTTTTQPTWTLLANLGDVSPIEYGGYFVYMDETGQYAPEVEVLDAPDDDTSGIPWTLYRFIAEPCTYQNGVLSDNPHHPDHPAWFAKDLPALASFVGMTELDLINQFCSGNFIERANAWRVVGDYFGYHELDQYPQTFTKRWRIERFARTYRPEWETK